MDETFQREGDTNGLLIDGNSTRGFARACAEFGGGESRLRACHPEHQRKEIGCASAFIYARVLSSAVRSQVGDKPIKVYQAGESFHERPGSHHRISENASDRDPASLLAVIVVDSDDNPLVINE